VKTKSIRYLPDGGAEIVSLDVDEPGSGQVQVEGTHCGICSWDIQTFKTGSEGPFAAPPGHEGVGHVTKLGPGVTGVEVGARVAGGGFAGLRNVGAGSLIRIPDSDLANEHWVVEPVACVVTGVDTCRLKPADRVALVGCGFMGLMILQVLLHSYADQVIALDVDDSRLALARKLGAKETYNTTASDFASVKENLIARDVDIVIDTSGAQGGFDVSQDIVRRGGMLNLFGWIKGNTATFNPNIFHTRGITIVNSSPSGKLRETFPAAIRLLDKGIVDLRPLVTHIVPIDEYPDFMGKLTKGNVDGYVKGVVALS
jgi:threonine dehydrogenase-like Zn-dependent dehydrogenase